MAQIHVQACDGYTVIRFELDGAPLAPSALRSFEPPERLLSEARGGLVISGRGPVWLYAYLVHWAHPFAWVATHDPRLGGAVVVSRHVTGAPNIGDVIPIEPDTLDGERRVEEEDRP